MNEGAIPNLMAEAAAAQAGGNPARAEALYNQVLKIAPGNPAVLNSLGVIALNGGDARKAIGFYERATAADPNAPVLWVNLARAWRAVPDDFEEQKALDKALSIDPTTITAIVRKGELHERRGEDVETMQSWQALLQHAPANHGGALDAVLAHARDFVGTRLGRLSSAMDDGLRDVRMAATGSTRRVDACVDTMLGKRRVYHNECAGVQVPFLPADEFFERDHFPWMTAFEAHTDAIRAELTSLLETGAPGFAPYVQQAPGTPENKWTPLDGKTAWSAYYLWHYGKPIEDAHARCPNTVKALAEVPLVDLPGRMPNVFFSILQPGAHIPPHTGVTNLRTIVHLPLIVPEGCQFRVGGETRAWREGESFAFDDTIEHEAINPTPHLRAVLILDVWNPHLTPDERVVLAKSLEIADQVGLGAGTVE